MSKKQMYVFSAFRGALIAICTFFVYSMIDLLIRLAIVMDFQLFQGIELFVICIFCTAAVPLVFNSFSLAFAYSNRLHIESFLEREENIPTIRGELKAFFQDPIARTELIALSIIIFLGALLGIFTTFEGMFPSGMPIGNILPAITITPVCVLLYLFSKYEAARYFAVLEREGKLDKLLSPSWLIVRIFILSVLYPVCAPMVPAVIYALLTGAFIFIKLSKLWTALGVIAALVLLISLIFSIKVLRGISKRRKFLKKARLVASTKGYDFCDLKTPYRSFLTAKDQCSFSLKLGDKSFDCVVISTLSKRVPLIFTSPTDAYFLHKIGTENHNFSLRHHIEFYHIGDGQKIIIVDPVPKKVLVSEDNRNKRVYCSDSIWGITVHDCDSFIGCMDRLCLDSVKK